MVIIKLKAKIFHVAWWITVMISGNQIASRPCCMVISEALQYSTGLCFFLVFCGGKLQCYESPYWNYMKLRFQYHFFRVAGCFLLPKSESSPTSSSSTHPNPSHWSLRVAISNHPAARSETVKEYPKELAKSNKLSDLGSVQRTSRWTKWLYVV